ncbi:hypothetical protein Pmani_023614 [Petrolisthes manimaculis]|uniref:Uncharacterized protein n=1 Tax=Petrolisthes manimaculis TaxID=1843537 RepID=A0AAE1U040_9EUCA|nr:hypothetical protein Pmani_023614 [Petrolisthes manimaculis]
MLQYKMQMEDRRAQLESERKERRAQMELKARKLELDMERYKVDHEPRRPVMPGASSEQHSCGGRGPNELSRMCRDPIDVKGGGEPACGSSTFNSFRPTGGGRRRRWRITG